jgi:hypothetical protein
MNIRWPLWIPVPRQDALLFIALALSTAYLLLGNFQNLPLIPSLSKLPTETTDIYLWLAAVTILNLSIVLKNSRNDYVFLTQQLIPCTITTLLIVAALAIIIALRNGVTWNTPWPEKTRYLLYSEIYAFVILNVSFLFKETSSPIRDISNDIRALKRILHSRPTGTEERQTISEQLINSAQSLASTFAKHATVLRGRVPIDATNYDLTLAAKTLADRAARLGPEALFKRLAEPDSEVTRLARGIIANATK